MSDDTFPSMPIASESGTPKRKPRKLEKRTGRASVDEGRPIESQASMREGEYESRRERDEPRDTFERRDSQLTDLPVGEDGYLGSESSVVDSSAGGFDDEEQIVDEHEMRRQLMDLESSFIPDGGPSSAAQSGGQRGADDTYLELGKPGNTPPPDQMFKNSVASRNTQVRSREAGGGSTGQGTPDVDSREISEDAGIQGEGSPYSPAAAAAQRTQTRNTMTSGARETASRPGTSGSLRVQGISHSPADSRATTPSIRSSSKGSTIRPGSAGTPTHERSFSGDHTSMLSLNGLHSLSPSRLNPRPSYFNSRQASHQSAVSTATFSTDMSGSDNAANADYALQTGGSMSMSTTLNDRRPADLLSRLPSLGSVASYMDRDSDGAPSFSSSVSGNILSNRHGPRFDVPDEERPETPRASTNRIQAPTDTVLAQRIESIQVPETVARDFRARNLSPQRPSSSSGVGLGAQDRSRRTLTLKEQNSKIDKLTKGNFDLKLKIHFLDQALQSRSDDGVKELIDKNVQLQTDLANERKETQSLRRRVRELERKVEEQAQYLAEAEQQKTAGSQRDDEDDPTLQAEMHEEILYLRQQLDYSENQVTTLREDVMTKELEKRKLAEHMRGMASSRGEDAAGMKETMDMWQDLLNAETGRREQAEEDIRKLREDLSALRIEQASPAASKVIKHKSLRRGQLSRASGDFEDVDGINGADTASSATLVEQLKHENGELRRDLGAQTSMLTSRNRERERLQQEIEDLKLLHRKGDGARSIAGDSIFERSISRAHQRAPSRASDHTHVTMVTEAERDDWDKKEGQLRDQNAELRLRYQELERTHNTHRQYVTALEGDFEQMEQELNEASEDLRALQVERDEALQAFEDKEAEYEKLEREAVTEVDKLLKENEALDTQLQELQRRSHKTQTKLDHTTDDYRGLQAELREITQSVMNLEDEKQANIRTIETLETQLAEAEDEMQKWEAKCKELDQKNRKLEITQESLHSEITFLREEQEGDKIKIGELEDALNAAQQTIQDEQEKLRELEEGIVEERQQRDVLENRSKDEVQKVLDELNIENGRTKDQVRTLRRSLSAKEVEASNWKQKLEELEQSLRRALGEPEGTKQSLLAEIDRMQREMQSTVNALDRAKMDLADKDRLLRHRDGLLESTSLESRRLSDLLDKERNSRKHDLDSFEKSTGRQASHLRELAHHQSRVLELESAYSHDKRKMATLETQLRDQLGERNSLLLALWNRLSTLCGSDWAQSHSLVNGDQPSVEVIGRALPAFNRNIITAVKTIEALMGSFKGRIRSIEKDLWRDYQTLEHNLDLRIRKIDGMEKAVRDAQSLLAEEQAAAHAAAAAVSANRPGAARQSSSKIIKSNEELAKLKTEVKVLKTELKFHRQHPSAMAQQMLNQQAQTSPDHARRVSSAGSSVVKPSPSPARAIVAQLLRHHSSSAVEQLSTGANDEELAPTPRQQPVVLATPPIQPSEQRWVHRLKELERRLKAEREARLLDRRGARQRLEEGRQENEELRQMLEREKMRRESMADGVSVADDELHGSEIRGERDVD